MFLTIVFLNFSSQRAKIHHITNLAKKNLILTPTVLLSLRLTITRFYTRQQVCRLHDPVGKKSVEASVSTRLHCQWQEF